MPSASSSAAPDGAPVTDAETVTDVAAEDVAADTAADGLPVQTLTGAADDAVTVLVYGEPLQELPEDLYIPPAALEVFLEAFEGPLDVLLYLIRRQNFNILDIPMAKLTRQYMEYVDEARKRNFELAAEYLLMAAMLINIKSRMLLPRPAADEEEDVGDPRAELVRRLLEYEAIKMAADNLGKLPQEGRDYWAAHHAHCDDPPVQLPDVQLNELQEAWRGMLRRLRLQNTHHQITREVLSVRQYMSRVLKQLQGQQFVEFEKLFDTQNCSVPVLVVTFIAILELVREKMIQVVQAEPYAPIYLRQQAGHSSNH